MSEFDEKLTILHKKFHFLSPGIISDILEQVESNLQMATEIISAMIMETDQSESKSEKDNQSDDDLRLGEQIFLRK